MKHIAKPLIVILAILAVIIAAAAFLHGRRGKSFVPGEFRFSGGSGKINISCELVTIKGRDAAARIVFSSPNYSYVKTGDTEYEGEYTESSSAFEIPVVLDKEFNIIACTTAMSAPHEIEYTLFISSKPKGNGGADTGKDSAEDGENGTTGGDSGAENSDGEAADNSAGSAVSTLKKGFSEKDAPEIEGLTLERSLNTSYAERFGLYYYNDGYKLLSVADGNDYLIVPAGKEAPESLKDDITVIKSPANIYLAATGAMSLISALDRIDSVKFSGTKEDGWYIDAPKAAMKSGSMIFAGKYSAPDFELLIDKGCDLAIESTMILHSPDIKEQLIRLGIPVFTDYSSYEDTALGRLEWIYAYAAMLDAEAEADAVFNEALKLVKGYGTAGGSGKSAAFFYINNANLAVIRRDDDYIISLIREGGMENAFKEVTPAGDAANMTVSLENLFEAASDADYIIYNGTIDQSVSDLKDLVAKSSFISDFKAVKEKQVYILDKEFYQSTDRLYLLTGDIDSILKGKDDGLIFLRKLS